MADKVAGFLEVGTDGKGQVILVHPDLDHLPKDASGVAHVCFSVAQARAFAQSVLRSADEAERERPAGFVVFLDP